MRQGYCYTCLAIGGGISVGSLRWKFAESRGFQRGVSVRGGKLISIIGVVRSPVAIIDFASNACENL